MTEIPTTHPRYLSLVMRERITEGVKNGITSIQGLIAHGRGEAFDYLIGEETTPPAKTAIKAAAAMLLLAKHPVLNVNGNVAALCPGEMVKLAHLLVCPLEVNLFHRTEERVKKIAEVLKSYGAGVVYGTEPDERIPGLDNERAKTTKGGTFSADVVLVPLEDGDRTEALVKMGKSVITIDLNPYSRTAVKSSITIVDNIIRALPLLTEEVRILKSTSLSELESIIKQYDNTEVLKEIKNIIYRRLAGADKQ